MKELSKLLKRIKNDSKTAPALPEYNERKTFVDEHHQPREVGIAAAALKLAVRKHDEQDQFIGPTLPELIDDFKLAEAVRETTSPFSKIHEDVNESNSDWNTRIEKSSNLVVIQSEAQDEKKFIRIDYLDTTTAPNGDPIMNQCYVRMRQSTDQGREELLTVGFTLRGPYYDLTFDTTAGGFHDPSGRLLDFDANALQTFYESASGQPVPISEVTANW